jgi:hypothetical protein
MHRAGAAALSHLLKVDPPEQPSIVCQCGQSAHYKEQRRKPILTVVGHVEYERPYYVCDQCHHAPNPTDTALGVMHEEFSPGVRRMMAVVGSESAFDDGREQLELLAGLHVSTKSAERQAERIGAEIMRLEQAEIQRSVQLELPIPIGPPIPVMYVEIDGTGIPVVRRETEGRAEPRIVPPVPELCEMLTMQKALRNANYPTCHWVFFNEGEPILSFKNAWAAACKQAKLVNTDGEPSEFFHDLRRTGVRNLVRADVPENVR